MLLACACLNAALGSNRLRPGSPLIRLSHVVCGTFAVSWHAARIVPFEMFWLWCHFFLPPLKEKNFHQARVPNQLKFSRLSPPTSPPSAKLGCNLDQLSSASSLKIEMRLWWFFFFFLGLKWIFSLCLPPRCAAATGLRWFKSTTVNKNFFSPPIRTISRPWLSGLLKIRGGVCVLFLQQYRTCCVYLSILHTVVLISESWSYTPYPYTPNPN